MKALLNRKSLFMFAAGTCAATFFLSTLLPSPTVPMLINATGFGLNLFLASRSANA